MVEKPKLEQSYGTDRTTALSAVGYVTCSQRR